MDIINLVYNLPVDLFSWLALLIFCVGYTWAEIIDNTTEAVASQMNNVQDEKLDRDGEIPATGTIQWDKGADVASAAALPVLGDGNYFDVTGTTTITSIDATQSQPGTVIKLHFDAILLIVHDGDNLDLPDDKDIYTMADTELVFTEYAAGKWRCTGYLRGTPILTNIFTHPSLEIWLQSDANKGLCTIAYDTGAKGAGAAPSVGDACVGANGATAKVISYTTATGAWADGDAAGVLTLGACTGGWTDNEVLTFAGVETAAVNGESIAITNDPCNNDGTGDWTDADSILSFDTDHYEIASDAINEKTYMTSLAFTEGKTYKVEAQLKDGTATPTDIELVSLNGATVEEASAPINTTGSFVTYSHTFKATANTDGVGIRTPTSLGGNNVEMKYFICYEISPCATAADTVAMDGSIKDSTLDIYREHTGSNVQDGSFFAAKMVVTTAADYVRFPGTNYDSEKWYMLFQGRTVTLGRWVKTSTASHAKLTITDSVGSTSSPYHSGGGTYEFLKVTRTINASATSVAFYIYGDIVGSVDGSTIIYYCQEMLIWGSNMDEGDYQPKQLERILTEDYADNNARYFANAEVGDNPDLYIYGYVTAGEAPRYGRFRMDDTWDEFVIEAENNANHEGVTISLLETNQRFRLRQNADTLSWYLDGTDAFMRWSDGQLEFQTDETNAPTVLRLKPNGTSEVSQLDFYDADGIRLSLYTAADRAYIESIGGVLGINPNAAQGVDLFEDAASSETPEFRIYGFRAADALRSLEIGVGVDAADTASFDGVSKFYFDGNIGIHVLNPTFKLEVLDTSDLIAKFRTIRNVASVSPMEIYHNRGVGNVADDDKIRIFTAFSDSDTIASSIFTAIGQIALDVTHATRSAAMSFFTTFPGGTFLEGMRLDPKRNLGIGVAPTFGDNALQVFLQKNGTAPTTSPADSYQVWSDDVLGVADKAGPHWRSEENGMYAWHGGAGTINSFTYQADVADDGIFSLPAITDSAWGFIQAGNNEEYAFFTIDDDGDVTLISNSANVVANADIDDKICVGTAGSQEPLQIRNRLGAQKNINLIIWYS